MSSAPPRRDWDLPVTALEPFVEGHGARQRVHLDAVFCGRRGLPTALTVHGAELDDGTVVERPRSNVRRLALRWPATTPTPRLRATGRAETPVLVKLVVRDASGQAAAVVPIDTDTRTPPQAHTPDAPDWEALRSSLSPEEYLLSIDRALATPEDDEITRGRRFFAALDRRTNPFLLTGLVALGRMFREDAAQRRMAIEYLGNELRERVRVRCRGLDAGRDSCPDLRERVLPHLVPKLRAISRVFLATVDEHFPGDPAGFERAFVLFANGALRLVLPDLATTTQPSSGNFFLFGELALAAIDHGVDAGRWSVLAGPMIRSQRIFARVYAPASLAGADFTSYSGSDYARRGAPLSEAELEALAAETRGASTARLARLAAVNAAAALPGIRA